MSRIVVYDVAMAKTIAIQELSRSEIHDIEAQFQGSRSVAQRQDAEKTPSPQETLKRRRRCFCFATCIGRKKAGSALGKAASQVRHFSNTRVPNSKAAEGGHRGGFALSPIRAVFSDSIGRAVETGSEAVRLSSPSSPSCRRRRCPVRPTNNSACAAVLKLLFVSGHVS